MANTRGGGEGKKVAPIMLKNNENFKVWLLKGMQGALSQTPFV